MAATPKTKKKVVTDKKVVKKPTKKAVTKKTVPAKKVTPEKKPVSAKKTVPIKKVAPTPPAKKPESVKKTAALKKAETPVKQPVAGKSKSGIGGKNKSAQPQNFVPYKAARNEDYMNDAQKKHFRGLLQTWKRNLMEEVDKTVHHMKDDVTNFPDPNDRASQEEEFSLELRARDRERKLIKKIDEALDNIDDDEYGYCEACGIEIGVERLEARPTASLCIDCKTLEEIKEKQTKA